MKKTGHVKLYRKEADITKVFSDPEFRLFILFRMIADWDKRHKTYGMTNVTIKNIQTEFLPEWSTGKISEIINHLIQKGFLSREGRSTIKIKNFWIWTIHNYQLAEQGLRHIELGIQPPEPEVQRGELVDTEVNRTKIKIMKENAAFGTNLFSQLNKSLP